MEYGLRSEYHRLRSVAVHTPGPELEWGLADDPVAHHIEPDLDPAGFREEHIAMKDAFRSEGVSVYDVGEVLGDEAAEGLPNLCFARDSSWVSRSGGVPLGMGLLSRGKEPSVLERFYLKLGIPVPHRLNGPEEMLEGGGIAYLDEETIIVGACSRSTPEGLSSLREHLFDSKDVKRVVEMAVLPEEIHIDGIFSIIGPELVVTAPGFIPDRPSKVYHADGTREESHVYDLIEGWDRIEITDQERLDGAANIVVIDEAKAVQFDFNPGITGILRERGWDMIELPGENIWKGNGGLHCLTCPIHRA